MTHREGRGQAGRGHAKWREGVRRGKCPALLVIRECRARMAEVWSTSWPPGGAFWWLRVRAVPRVLPVPEIGEAAGVVTGMEGHPHARAVGTRPAGGAAGAVVGAPRHAVRGEKGACKG